MPNLSPSQIQALKTDLSTNANTVLVGTVSMAIDSITGTAQTVAAAVAVANWYNQQASPNYFVVSTDADIVDIENVILWPNYTPNFAITNSTSAQAANQATCASMLCQGKQFNLQLLLQKPNQGSFDATKATQVAGLKDATTNLPAGGAAGSFTNVNAGWGNIVPLLSRTCSNIEKLFANLAGQAASTLVPPLYDGTSAQGASGNPSVMTYEGDIDETDVQAAWA